MSSVSLSCIVARPGRDVDQLHPEPPTRPVAGPHRLPAATRDLLRAHHVRLRRQLDACGQRLVSEAILRNASSFVRCNTCERVTPLFVRKPAAFRHRVRNRPYVPSAVRTIAEQEGAGLSAFRDSLAVLLRARFPVLYIESFEERRVLAEIAVVTGPEWFGLPTPRPSIYVDHDPGAHRPRWEVGLKHCRARQSTGVDPTTRPAGCLCLLRSSRSTRQRNAAGRPGIVRRIRDVAGYIPAGCGCEIAHSGLAHSCGFRQTSRRTYTSSTFRSPVEEDIRAILDGIIASNASSGRIQVDLDEENRERLVKAALGLTELETEGAALALWQKTVGWTPLTSSRCSRRSARLSARLEYWSLFHPILISTTLADWRT